MVLPKTNLKSKHAYNFNAFKTGQIFHFIYENTFICELFYVGKNSYINTF